MPSGSGTEQPEWGAPEVRLTGLAAEKDGAVEAAAALPALRATAQRRAVELRQADQEWSSATARAALARQAAAEARLPQAWRALLAGRYRPELSAAEENLAAAEAELSRTLLARMDAAARLRAADALLATKQSQAQQLPDLLGREQLDRLRADDDPAAQPVLTRVEESAARVDAARQRLAELDRAAAALTAAQQSVRIALDRLGRAGDWGTYDVVFGGVVSSLAKHDHLDDAARATAEVHRAWDRARAELGDIRLAADLPGRTVAPATRMADVWFDNLFTDLAVQGEIREQEHALRTLSARMHDLAETVATQTAEATAALKRETTHRASLLDHPDP